MNASDVLKVLDDIAATSSRNEKEEILGRFIADPFFRRVLSVTYDSFITWGVTPPKVEPDGRQDFDATTVSVWSLLDGLAERSITGGEAHQLVLETLQRLSPSASELFYRILLKDLRCGIATSTINKVLPGTVPRFECQLAHPFEDKRIKKWPAIVEPKLDGFRVICLVRDGKAQFFSRSGKPFPAVDHLKPKIEAMVARAIKSEDAGADFFDGKASVALDGEIVVGKFAETSGAMRRKSEEASGAIYSIFDIVPYDFMTGELKSYPLRYEDRRKLAHWLVDQAKDAAITKLKGYYVSNADEARLYYQGFRDDGLEGAIVKALDAPYEKRRSNGWLKLKAEETEDLRIVGWYEGEESTKLEGKFGGFIVERLHETEMVLVNVGGGFSDKLRDELLPQMQALSVGQTPYVEKGKIKRRLNAPWRLIEVEFHEVTPDGSLRHPRFVAFRDDKDTLDQEAA